MGTKTNALAIEIEKIVLLIINCSLALKELETEEHEQS
jgi:hypothetical protein